MINPEHSLIIEAEKALLGAILIESSCRDIIPEINIDSDDFIDPYHQDIYRTMIKLSKQGQLPHVVNVPRQMWNDDLFPKDKNGVIQRYISYFMQVLVADCPNSIEYESYALAVKEYSLARQGKKKPTFKGTI